MLRGPRLRRAIVRNNSRNDGCGGYCGPEGSLAPEVPTGVELGGVTGSGKDGVPVEVAGIECDLGGSGTVVMALSGFRRWSLLGPSPRLMSARESGTVLLCQPWSA